MKYEYKVIVLKRGEASRWAVVLNKYGEAGWDLVQVFEFAAFLKRPKE